VCERRSVARRSRLATTSVTEVGATLAVLAAGVAGAFARRATLRSKRPVRFPRAGQDAADPLVIDRNDLEVADDGTAEVFALRTRFPNTSCRALRVSVRKRG
jgi:hypothetical protein